MSLQKFLDAKPLYYDKIDYTRMPRVYEKVQEHFKHPKIIHLIGTNGKGTTGRFFASALASKGFNVGHYTSPHILEFNERIWLNGAHVSEEELEKAHNFLSTILSKEDADQLSYFEYTTFLGMLVYKECDYVVLEAGLGGEHDATAVFEKELTLVTPIDFDHEAFLGSSIKEIATTKLNAIQNNAILAKQKFRDVENIAKEMGLQKDLNIYDVEELLSADDFEKIAYISQQLSLVDYLQANLQLSISGLKFLNIEYDVEDFKDARLFGRLTPLDTNILIDVGHNPLAATSILKALSPKRYNLIYNSYKDKNYQEILNILKPIIKKVEIIELKDERVVSKAELQSTLNNLEIEYTTFNKINLESEYLVFGSFSVVEEFLKGYYE